MEEQKTHNEIYREIGRSFQQIENLEVRADGHDQRLMNIETVVNASSVLAHAADARLARIEETLDAIKAKVLAYDILKSNIRWAFITGTTIIGAWFASFWTLSGGRIVEFFNTHRGVP